MSIKCRCFCKIPFFVSCDDLCKRLPCSEHWCKLIVDNLQVMFCGYSHFKARTSKLNSIMITVRLNKMMEFLQWSMQSQQKRNKTLKGFRSFFSGVKCRLTRCNYSLKLSLYWIPTNRLPPSPLLLLLHLIKCKWIKCATTFLYIWLKACSINFACLSRARGRKNANYCASEESHSP